VLCVDNGKKRMSTAVVTMEYLSQFILKVTGVFHGNPFGNSWGNHEDSQKRAIRDPRKSTSLPHACKPCSLHYIADANQSRSSSHDYTQHNSLTFASCRNYRSISGSLFICTGQSKFRGHQRPYDTVSNSEQIVNGATILVQRHAHETVHASISSRALEPGTA